MIGTRCSRPEEDVAGEIAEDMRTVIGVCARAAEAELRVHPEGTDKLQLLPCLVEQLQATTGVAASSASSLRDLTMLACRSCSSDLTRELEQEKREYVAAERQDREELQAIEAHIRDVRKNMVVERRSLQDFQAKAMACAYQYRDLHKRRLHPLLKGAATKGDTFIDDPKAVSLVSTRAASAQRQLQAGETKGQRPLSERTDCVPVTVDEDLAQILAKLMPALYTLATEVEPVRAGIDVVSEIAHDPRLPSNG